MVEAVLDESACRKLSHGDPRSGCFFPAVYYIALQHLSYSMFSSLSFKHTPSHASNSTEDEVTVLCIPAPYAVLVQVQMYAKRQESALGVSHGERVLPFPWEAAEAIC